MKYRISILTLAISLFAQTSFVSAATFTDVNSSTPYVDSIYWTVNEGVTQGYGDGKWGPDNCVTRAELLKMTFEYKYSHSFGGFEKMTEGLNEDDGFSDVNKEDWFYDYVRLGKNLKVIEGYEDKTFKPNDCVNRVESMKIAVNILMPGGEKDGSAPLFYDDKIIADMSATTWYSTYARALFTDRLVGTVHTQQASQNNFVLAKHINFFPNGDMSRKEVAHMIYNISKKFPLNS